MGDGLTLNPGAGSGQLIFLIRGSPLRDHSDRMRAKCDNLR